MADSPREYEFLDADQENAKLYQALTEAGKRVEAQLVDVEAQLEGLPQQRDELKKAFDEIKSRRDKLPKPSDEALAQAAGPAGPGGPVGPPPGVPQP